MATITAALVKDLREKTGAGMMDCKAALSETDGDIEAAVDWLRKKGLSKAAKKSGRVAAEGLVAVARRRPRSASSSRSIPRPTSSPATTISRRWSRNIAEVALENGATDVEALAGRSLSGRRHGRATRSPTPSPPSART